IKEVYDAGQRIFGENKVQELLKKYQELKIENQQLKKSLAAQTKDLSLLNNQFSDLEQKLLLQHIGTQVMTSEEKQQMKQQITQVIGEIDKLLHSLHD
ncbi:MAG TPA: hypothetical protein PLQ78_08585, partial [Flavipsychrobacter sp.]|nr:hypothetical protein [Flavipsychrobacter sp.]